MNKARIQWPTVVVACVAVVAGAVLLALDVEGQYATALFGLATGAVLTRRAVE